MRGSLGDTYTEKLREVFKGRVPGKGDLCIYWFEKARQKIEGKGTTAVGLIGTQGIRGTTGRPVIERILETGSIFEAWSDLEWILDGAAVHVSIICYQQGKAATQKLNGELVAEINSNLTSSTDANLAKTITKNKNIGFIGSQKGGKFEIDIDSAIEILSDPNPHGRPNSDVIFPFGPGALVSDRTDLWIVDFAFKTQEESAKYTKPYDFAFQKVRAARTAMVDRDNANSKWWQHQRPRPEMREALANLDRFCVTICHAKYRLFRWFDKPILPANALVAFAVGDDYTFGVLHSRFHEVWALAQGTQLREKESGFRYTPTTCFETFPFPEPTDAKREIISAAAKELDRLRENWLNPEEWTQENVLEFPATVGGPWHRWIPDAENLTPGSIATARYVRRVAHPATAKALAKRTLTNLYNERPAWLLHAHEALDNTVADAYGFAHDISDAEILSELLRLNLEIAARESADQES